MKKKDRDPVIVRGVRTPFLRSHKAYVDLKAYDLGRLAVAGLMEKVHIPPEELQSLIIGNVLQDPQTPNIAREIGLASGLPHSLPAHTVSLACISSNVAATQMSDMIRLGHINCGIFGGVDTFSDPPIRVSRALRKVLVRLEKVKNLWDLKKEWPYLKELRWNDLLPEIPKVVEFSNGKSMGEGAEILAQRAGVTRGESDSYAARSHKLAVLGKKQDIFKEDIIPVRVSPYFEKITKDDGPREDATMDRLSKLSPAFDRKFGVCTAGNSSFLTDGASAVLMMSRAKAQQLGYESYGILKDYVYVAGDPLTEMLAGPALAIPKLLAKTGLRVEEIGVWEIHEAFAAQMVANLKYLKDGHFAKTRLNMDEPVGEIPMDRLNIWGGSLSLGHPFGATGGRLIWTAARRMKESRERFAVVAGCAAGGHGSAILLENEEV